MNLSGPGPHGLVPRSCDADMLDVTGHADLVRVLSNVWELPYAGVCPMDGLTIWNSASPRYCRVPYGADQLLLIPMSGEVSLPRAEGEPVRLSGQATLLSRSSEETKLSLKGEATLLVLYRLKQSKTVENLSKAKRAGLYPHCPSATAQKKQGVPSSSRSGPLGTVDIERWRLRQGQEEDPELAPYLCVLEKGEHTLRRKFERSLAEQVVQDVGDYEIQDGLLAKKVRLSSGQYHYVPVIPSGGARAITWNGQKRMLTWKHWILHILHNTTAGGHVGEHALEQRVLEIGWWKRLGRDCHSWCMRCAVCRAVHLLEK